TDYTSEGTYDVHFSVTDQMATATRIAHIVVAHKNQAPIFDNAAEYTLYERDTLSFVVHASDVDHDPMTYGVTAQPAGSTFDVSTQQFTWVPDYGTAPGPYFAVFTASDGQATT